MVAGRRRRAHLGPTLATDECRQADSRLAPVARRFAARLQPGPRPAFSLSKALIEAGPAGWSIHCPRVTIRLNGQRVRVRFSRDAFIFRFESSESFVVSTSRSGTISSFSKNFGGSASLLREKTRTEYRPWIQQLGIVSLGPDETAHKRRELLTGDHVYISGRVTKAVPLTGVAYESLVSTGEYSNQIITTPLESTTKRYILDEAGKTSGW